MTTALLFVVYSNYIMLENVFAIVRSDLATVWVDCCRKSPPPEEAKAPKFKWLWWGGTIGGLMCSSAGYTLHCCAYPLAAAKAATSPLAESSGRFRRNPST